MATMGERIKTARVQAGLTQNELGEKVGVSGVAIMRYEKGLRTPKLQLLKDLSKALNVSTGYLMGLVLSDEDAGIVEPEEDELREEVKDLTYSLNEIGLRKTRDYMRDLMANQENCPPGKYHTKGGEE